MYPLASVYLWELKVVVAETTEVGVGVNAGVSVGVGVNVGVLVSGIVEESVLTITASIM